MDNQTSKYPESDSDDDQYKIVEKSPKNRFSRVWST